MRRATKAFLFLFALLTLLPGDVEARKKRSRFLSEAEALERLASIEFHRSHKDSYLRSALYHPSSKVVKRAILTLGRIGDPMYIESLVPFLKKRNLQIKKLAGFSVSLLGGDLARAMLTQHAQLDRGAAARGQLWIYTGLVGNKSTLSLYRNALNQESDRYVLRDICHGLAHLLNRSDSSWDPPQGLLQKLLELSVKPDPLAYTAAFALSRFRGDPKAIHLESLIQSLKRTPSLPTRALLIRVLGKQTDPKALPILIAQTKSPLTLARQEAASALGMQAPSALVFDGLGQSLRDRDVRVLINALDSTIRFGSQAKALYGHTERLHKNSKSTWVKARSLMAMVATHPEKGQPFMEQVLAKPKHPLFHAGVRALGYIPTESAAERLFVYLKSPDGSVAAKAADALNGVSPKIFNKARKTILKSALLRGDVALTTVLATLVADYRMEDMAHTLTQTYQKLDKREHLEAKVAVLSALGRLNEEDTVPTLKTALNDPDREVVKAALAAITAITGKEDPNFVLPIASKFTGISPSIEEVRAAMRARVQINTTRGSFIIKMLELAPLNAHNFIKLVKSNFYPGKTFHRVVPNFVVQGGDPRGDGFGGPGYFVRDEVSPKYHERGTVGLATAGKDTGGSQFFINLTHNLHLDGRYTIFGKVTAGMDTVDRLEVGDKITGVRLLK